MLNIIVNTSNGDAPRFGMQSTAVDANGENAGSFNNPSSNAQLGSVNDRHIFEHSGASSTNTFSVNWTSPSEGGNVTFYAAGLAAGNPTSPQGDEHNLAQLVLPAGEPVVTHVDQVAWTAPTNWNGQTWQWQAPSSGRLVVGCLRSSAGCPESCARTECGVERGRPSFGRLRDRGRNESLEACLALNQDSEQKKYTRSLNLERVCVGRLNK